MTGQVFTKLHEALATAHHPEAMDVGAGAKSADVRELLDDLAQLPHFVLQKELAEDFDGRALTKSLAAMSMAGVLRLPYPRLLVEIWAGIPTTRTLVLVEEAGLGKFEVSAIEWVLDTLGPMQGMSLSDIFRASFEWSDKPAPDADEIWGADENGGVTPVEWGLGDWGFTVHFTDMARKRLITQLGLALMLTVAMTNISGLERVRVEPKPSFNRARAERGKHPIPTHTVVRIGHVYDSAGRRVAYSRDGAGRKPMAVHMRAAHTRWQHHGAQWMEEHPDLAALPGNTADGHRVLIDAVLVNYKDGTDLAKPLPKVVKL